MATSHKRDTDAGRFRLPRTPCVAGGLAVLTTLLSVGVGLLAANPATRDLLVASGSSSVARETDSGLRQVAEPVQLQPVERQPVVSRSGDRLVREEPWAGMLEDSAVAKAVRSADERLWTTAPLNLWADPGADATRMGLLEDSKKVLVTGRVAAGRTEVVVDGEARWVTEGYLSEENPNSIDDAGDSAPPAGATSGTCSNGTSVPSGVSPNIAAVHRAVCANFPEITTYGTLRSDGEHAQGIAVDIMVSGARGQEVADFVRANFSELGVNYVIHAQQIWSVDRSTEGWRFMEDRGSVTANHYDHVHVTTY